MRFKWIVILMIVGLGLPQISHAQYDDTITNRDVTRTYMMTGEQGDTLTVSMRRLSGDLVPILALQDESQNFVARSQPDATNSFATLEYTFQESGRFTLYATRFDVEQGTTQGDYYLTIDGVDFITPAPSDVVYPVTSNVYFILTPEMQIKGLVNSELVRTPYYVYLEANTSTEFVVDTINGDLLVPTLSLQSLDGAFLQYGLMSTNSQSILQAIVDVSGWYIVEVSRLDGEAGETTGQFILKQQ